MKEQQEEIKQNKIDINIINCIILTFFNEK